jgi:hypothetical protein
VLNSSKNPFLGLQRETHGQVSLWREIEGSFFLFLSYEVERILDEQYKGECLPFDLIYFKKINGD